MKRLHQKSTEVKQEVKEKLIKQALLIDQIALDCLKGVAQNPVIVSSPMKPNPVKSKKESKKNKEVGPLNLPHFCSSEQLIQNFITADSSENKKWGVVVACSHHKPGGGWRSGAMAQEESVSRQSTWGWQAEQHIQPWHQSAIDYLGPMGAFVINGVWLEEDVFNNVKNKKNALQEVVFIGVGAANKNAAPPGKWEKQKDERLQKLTNDLLAGFKEAEKRGATDIALCALGSGVFGWDIHDSVLAISRAISQCPKINYTWVCGCVENQQIIEKSYQVLRSGPENFLSAPKKFGYQK